MAVASCRVRFVGEKSSPRRCLRNANAPFSTDNVARIVPLLNPAPQHSRAINSFTSFFTEGGKARNESLLLLGDTAVVARKCKFHTSSSNVKSLWRNSLFR